MRSAAFRSEVEVVLLSPHLDDAALSASVQLQRAKAELVTVFAGPPPEGLALTDYDRMTGARSSGERFRERLLEDDRAMEVLGVRTVRLDALDYQYRNGPISETVLQELLRPYVDRVGEVWVPAGIGGHPDHLAVRQAALAVTPPETAVRLYADVPYSLRYGWPGWVTGRADPPFLDIAFWLDRKMRSCGLDPGTLTAEVFVLTAEEREVKERSVLEYRTQLPALGLSAADSTTWEALLSHEVSWQTTQAEWERAIDRGAGPHEGVQDRPARGGSDGYASFTRLARNGGENRGRRYLVLGGGR